MLGKKQTKYNEAIRSFAVTIHLHSPAAYNYIRKNSMTIYHMNVQLENGMRIAVQMGSQGYKKNV